MRNTIILLLTICCTAACQQNNTSKFDTSKLIGRYKLEFQFQKQEEKKKTTDKIDYEAIGTGLANLLASSFDVEIIFSEKQNGIMYINAGMVDGFLGKYDRVTTFDYKVDENDVLSIRKKGGEKYERFIKLRKFDATYSFLECDYGDSSKVVKTLMRKIGDN